MNIGIGVLILVFIGVTYLLPLTIASVVATIYISKIGLAGYSIVGSWSNSGSSSVSMVLAIVFIMIAFVDDIVLWKIGKRSGKKQELQK